MLQQRWNMNLYSFNKVSWQTGYDNTRQNTKEIKEHPKIYKSIGNGTFDYIPLKSQEQYSISFRVIRFSRSND